MSDKEGNKREEELKFQTIQSNPMQRALYLCLYSLFPPKEETAPESKTKEPVEMRYKNFNIRLGGEPRNISVERKMIENADNTITIRLCDFTDKKAPSNKYVGTITHLEYSIHNKDKSIFDFYLWRQIPDEGGYRFDKTVWQALDENTKAEATEIVADVYLGILESLDKSSEVDN